jgi:hypothetical protein
MAAAVLIQILIEGAFLKTRVKMRDIIPGSQKKKKKIPRELIILNVCFTTN